MAPDNPTMVADVPAIDTQFGPWNPGLQSQIPRELRGGCTIFRPENTSTAIDVATEMHDLTGLEASDLVAFTPQRLALHELLIRVSTDLSVPDGSKIEDLGINFRQITRAILSRYIEPETTAIAAAYDAARQALSAIIAAELAALLDPSRATSPAADPARRWSEAARVPWRRRNANGDARRRRGPGTARAGDVAGQGARSLRTGRACRLPRTCESRLGAGRSPRARVGRARADCRDRDESCVQRLRQRCHRRRGGLADPARRQRRRLRPAALARPAGRHEHQGCVGLGQEHAASAPEEAGRETSACAGANSR